MSLFAWIASLQQDPEYIAALDEWAAADEAQDEAGREAALDKMEARSDFYSGVPAPKDAH